MKKLFLLIIFTGLNASTQKKAQKDQAAPILLKA